MSSLPKGESMGTKLVELFSNRMVERRIMIMSIKREELASRVLGGVDFRGSFKFFYFEFFFTLFLGLLFFVPFSGLAVFRCR
jgi:hypothetical protein